VREGPLRKKISFVIAVYHNEGALSETYARIASLFRDELANFEYEIIFVDDGSTDNSAREVLGLREKDPQVKLIMFTRNFGQMSAMLAGFLETTGDAVINISADLQDPVSLIPQMVKSWQQGGEIVICHRKDRSDHWSAKLFSRVAYGMLRLSLPQIPLGGFDFVLMDRKVMDTFNATDVRHRFFQGDLLWTGYRTSLIPYTRLERTIGQSQYNFSKKIKNFLDAILDVSYLPIRFMSLLGIVTAAIGVLYGSTIAVAWFRGDTPFEGWAPLMIVILLLGGLVMVMLGMIGEYIWRIYEEVRKRPNYLIRDKFL
jgi:polyisoprenyl-phosphate glycosyltransferase